MGVYKSGSEVGSTELFLGDAWGLNPPILPGKEMALEGLMLADYLLEIRPSLRPSPLDLSSKIT